MTACGACIQQDEEEEQYFATKRIDLSFINAGSSHMPAEQDLEDLVIWGEYIPVGGYKSVDNKEQEVRVNTEYVDLGVRVPVPLQLGDEDEEDHHDHEDSDHDEKTPEYDRMPTTVFETLTTPRKKKSSKRLKIIDEKKALEAAQRHEQEVTDAAARLEKVGAIPKQEELLMDGRGRRQTMVTTATGKVISKKLATAVELEGCIIAHIFFSTMRGNRNFPPLVVTIPKNWPFIKMMRKGMAGMQKTIKKGERPSHDWIYKYHVNKDVSKMRKDIKILFGDKKIEYRGSNLNKKIETAALEPFVNRFWILPRKVEKNKYYRGRR